MDGVSVLGVESLEGDGGAKIGDGRVEKVAQGVLYCRI